MVSSRPDLDPLQRDVLQAFFQRERAFFLTGGGALVGFHLHHRQTGDLDLFTLDEAAFARGRSVLAETAAAVGGQLVTRLDAPGFQRHVLERGTEGVVVDLVLERVAQWSAEKPTVDGVRVDPPTEILANKLTTLLSRSEERDLVDVWALERSGLRVEDALPHALRKDGACTPAQLAFVLSDVAIPDGASLPGGVNPADLRTWLAALIGRLRHRALPGG